MTGRFTPGALCQMPISRSESGYGSGLRSTPSTTLNTTVFAPMPTASVMRVIAVKSGA